MNLCHPFNKALGLLLTLLLLSSTAQAQSFFNILNLKDHWTGHFYTDDSPYYQKVYRDGFEIRFRVHQNYCQHIKGAEIVFRNSVLRPEAKFSPLLDLSGWPKLYGLNKDEWCWYSARVEGLDHNRFEHLQYVIKFENGNGQISYFEGESNSLLPQNRFTQRVRHWMTPGMFGATPVIGGGVLFKVWEPIVDDVHLYINDQKTAKMIPSAQRGENLRWHSFYASDSEIGDHYHFQFVVNGEYEEVEVSNDGRFSPVKIDPMAREVTYDRKGGSLNGYLNPRAVVASATPEHNWQNDHLMTSIKNIDYDNWIIYQLWPLAFNPQKFNGEYQVGTFNDILPKLDYIQGLGVTAIEFLPVHESRFHASWGYALDSLTLIEKNYGTREELANLVDEIHGRGLKVIFDVVINHVNNYLLREPLSATVNTSKFYGGDTEWGPKPDFNNVMVRKWIADSLLNLARDYHLDGYRWDMIERIFIDSANGYRFLQEMNLLLKGDNPRFYNSAEQLPDNVWATFPLSEGGLGYDSQWSDKFKNFFEMEFDFYRENNRNLDVSPLIGSLLGFSNHRNSNGEYHFGGPNRVVNYLGSHDVVGNKNPILRIVSDFQSYETVGNNTFFRVRPLEEPFNTQERFRQIHNSFTHSVGMLGYGILFSTQGAALFFQGEEFAQDINIENEWSYIDARDGNTIPTKDVDIDRFVRSHRVPWEYLNTRESAELRFLTDSEHKLFSGYYEFNRQMIQFKKNHPELNLEYPRNVTDHGNGLISYILRSDQKTFFVVLNFGEDKTGQWIRFPGSSRDWWNEVITSSEPSFGLGQPEMINIIPQLGGRPNLIRLAGTSFNLFERSHTPHFKEDFFFRSNLGNWQALEEKTLRIAGDGRYLLSTEIDVPYDQVVEFKVANGDWTIELGQQYGDKNDPLALIGQLSYVPRQSNARIDLKAGRYQFIFNIKNFQYIFIPVEDKNIHLSSSELSLKLGL